MNKKNFFPIIGVIVIAVLARLLYLFDWHEVWWDAGAYVGIGKFLWSLGQSGLFENIRPLVWPFVIGFFWKISLNPVFWARMTEFLLSIASIWLVYLIGKELLSKRAAFFASIVFSFSAIFFFFGFHEYTEIPAVFFALAGVYALIKKKDLLSGILVGLAFLTKFPAGIFFVATLCYLLLRKKWLQGIRHAAGFAVPTSIFFMANLIAYKNPFAMLIFAHESIISVLGCNVLRFKPWWQYFVWVFVDNRLNIAAILGLFIAIKKRSWLLLGCLALPLAYFLALNCRDYRYALLFLPFIALLTGLGLEKIESWLPRFFKYAFVLLVVGISVFNGVLFYHGNERTQPIHAEEGYFRWLAENPVDGEVWSSNPIVSVYSDLRINKIWFPVFEEGRALEFNEYLRKNSGRIGAVLLDNCGGGIMCPPGNAECEAELDSMRSFLNENFRQVFFAEHGKCWYAVYARQN